MATEESQPAAAPRDTTIDNSSNNNTTTTTTTTSSNDANPPASPPLPERHTAVTPGPRAARFQETYSLALGHTLAKVSWDNFAACYPTMAARTPGLLRQVQKQMVDRLRELCDVSVVLFFLGRRRVGEVGCLREGWPGIGLP